MTLTQVDYTIFEALRKACVAAGYLPDYASFTGTTDVRRGLYAAAKDVIRDAGKEIVEVFNVGYVLNDKGIKAPNKISINRKSELLGNIGFGVNSYFVENDSDSFDKVNLPDSSVTITYDIRIISSSAKYNRIMYSIVQKALGTRRSLKVVNEDLSESDDYLHIAKQGSVTISSDEFYENSEMYIVTDAILYAEQEDEAVNKLSTIEFSLLEDTGNGIDSTLITN